MSSQRRAVQVELLKKVNDMHIWNEGGLRESNMHICYITLKTKTQCVGMEEREGEQMTVKTMSTRHLAEDESLILLDIFQSDCL